MTPEIRRAALLAAAKTTFVVSLGCSNTVQPTPTIVAPTPPTRSELPCAEHLAGLAFTEGSLPPGDPLHDKPGVYGAFLDIAARSDPHTLKCCSEALGKDEGPRWACCSALEHHPGTTPNSPKSSDLFAACTPWGPPCPRALPV